MEGEETPRAIRVKTTKTLRTFGSFVSPTAGAIIFLLSSIFTFYNALLLIGILALSSAIIGWFLQFQDKKHQDQYDGSIVITENENGGKMFSIEVNGEPLDMEFKDEVLFKIKHVSDTQ